MNDNLITTPSQSRKSSFDYLIFGSKLIWAPNIRWLVLLPFFISTLFLTLLIAGIAPFIQYLSQIMRDYGIPFSGWLADSFNMLLPFFMIGAVFIWTFFFGTLINVIAAPFNGILSEKVEAKLRNKPVPETSFFDIIKLLPRVFWREIVKISYALSLYTLCFLVLLIPVVNLFSPAIWFILSAWLTNIQYADYPFDNHKVPFSTMRKTLRKNAHNGIIFGMFVNIGTLIPLLNLLIMPIAVCAATAMWVDDYAPTDTETKLPKQPPAYHHFPPIVQ